MSAREATAAPATDLLRQLDEAGITRAHWKIMFISGMGFFTDAYDLFIIGVVMSIVKHRYPAELFPVESCTTGHGIASAAGKIGGFAGVFLFPICMSRGGLHLAEGVAALVSLLGLAVTTFMLPETKGLSLEELSAGSA